MAEINRDMLVPKEEMSNEISRDFLIPAGQSQQNNQPQGDGTIDGVSPFMQQHPNIYGAVGAGQAIGETAKNIPKSGFEFIKNIASAVVHPVQTTQALSNVAKGGFQKLKTTFPGLKGGSPEDEQAFDTTINFFSQRFGLDQDTWGEMFAAFGETAKNDPVGVMADISAILSGLGTGVRGAGVVSKVKSVAKAGKELTTKARALDPVGAVSGAVGTAMSKRQRVNSIIKTQMQFQSVKGVKARKAFQLQRIDELAEAFLQRGDLNINRKSLKLLDTETKKIMKEIDDMLTTKTAEGIIINSENIVNAIDEFLDVFQREGFKIDDLQTMIKTKQDFIDLNGATVTPKQLQDIKVGYNKGYEDLTGRGGKIQSKLDNKIRTTARQALEDMFPELDGINQLKSKNQQLAINKDIRDAINAAIIRTEKAPEIPVKGLVAGGIAGGVTGAASGIGSGVKFAAAAIGITKIATNPRVQIAVARAIHQINLAKAKVGKLSSIEPAAFQAGRIEEQTNQIQAGPRGSFNGTR